MHRLATCLNTIIAVFFIIHSVAKGDNPTVSTTYGRVLGLRKSVLGTTLDTFYGIPYAKPPTGNRRFKRPEKAEPWDDVKNAQKLPHSCFQLIDTSFNRSEGVDMWNPNTPMSEDCLTLTIWAPQGVSVSSGKKMAVMVWIYGGTFAFGTTTLEVYDGSYLAVHSDVIVASINYRVGALGFLYLGTEKAPGNVGLLDQSLGLKWIHDNIESFGGDKNKITIFGESAGAASVGLHLLSLKSHDYFTNAIMQSSSPLCYWALQSKATASKHAEGLAAAVNCPNNDKESMVNCLMKSDPKTLSDKQWNVVEYYFEAPFAPVVDGYFLEDEPAQLIQKGAAKKTSVLLGVNHDEGNYFLLYGIPDYFKLHNNKDLDRNEFLKAIEIVAAPSTKRVNQGIVDEYETGTPPALRGSYREILDDISGDKAFKCPTIDFARDYSRITSNVYLYSFNYRVSTNPWPKWMGVIHGYEIELVFGLPLNTNLNYSEEDKDVSKRMMTYWSNFAKNGNPNPGDQNWLKFDLGEENYVTFTASGTQVKQGLRHQQCAFWRETVPVLKGSSRK